MSMLSYNIMIFRLLGLWYREENNFTWKRLFYKFHTTFLVSMFYTLTISEVISLCGSLDPSEFLDASFLSITRVLICWKIYNILSKSKYIIHMINTLETGSFKARNLVESSIQIQFSQKIGLIIILYGGLIEITTTTIIYGSIVTDIPQHKLAYKAWLPFDISKPTFYWIAFIHQHFSGYCGGSMIVAFDTMLVGLMISICAQLKILKYRICHGHNTFTEKNYLIDCIEHHKAIYEFAEMSNKIFSFSIFFQYFASSIILCASTFKLSQEEPFTEKFNNLLLYLIIMLLQIFMLCYWATQVQVESENIITGVYKCDWPSFSIETKKSLLLTMVRARIPIQYSSGYVVNLSLAEFTNLLKMSYSIYNILQQSNSKTR